MATANIIVGTPGSIPTPPAGEATLFIDTTNNNTLTLKLSDGSTKVYTSENAAECCSCEIAKKYAEDIACALKSGMLTGAQFKDLVNIGFSATATETNDGDGNTTCTVEIGPKVQNVPPQSINIIPELSNIVSPTTYQFYAQFTPLNTTNQTVVWSSSDNSVATVNQNGVVTFLTAGNVTITATSAENPAISGTQFITVA